MKAVLGLGLTLFAILLAGCSSEIPNQKACAEYELAFNALMESISAGDPPARVNEHMENMGGLIGRALDSAEGDVAIQIRASRDAALLVPADTTGSRSLDFFVSSSAVDDACAASGNRIELGDGE